MAKVCQSQYPWRTSPEMAGVCFDLRGRGLLPMGPNAAEIDPIRVQNLADAFKEKHGREPALSEIIATLKTR